MSVERSDSTGDPITFEDLGIPQRPHTQDTILGKARTWSDITKTEIAFLVISLLSLSSALGMTIYNAAIVFMPTDADFTFALLLILHICFCAYYIIHGVFSERPYELFVFVVATILLVVYIVINFIVKDGTKDTVKLVRLITICVLGPIDVGFGAIILVKYHRTGNLIFRSVGANTELQAACKTLYFFETCLKLDLQLECSLLLLVLQSGTFADIMQKIVLGIGFPVSIIWLILGYVTARMEQKIAMIVFLAASWFEPAYIVYIIVKCAQKDSGLLLDLATYVCSGCALVIRVMVIVWMIKVYKNFGMGLKEKVFRQQSVTTETDESAG